MIRSLRSSSTSSSRVLELFRMEQQTTRAIQPASRQLLHTGHLTCRSLSLMDSSSSSQQQQQQHASRHQMRPLIPNTTRRESSAFSSSWSNSDFKEWHDPHFLSDATVQEKEKWLELMLQRREKQVDLEAFLLVLKALASSPHPGAPRRAERWMNRLQEQQQQHANGLQPQRLTADCYQAVIQAWANSSKEEVLVVINRAERWLNDLIEESKDHPEDGVQPTIECYNAFLDACTRGRSTSNKRNHQTVERNAKKADAILRILISQHHHLGEKAPIIPNTDTFNYVIRGWTRCKYNDLVAKRVMSLIRLMETYQRKDPINSPVKPNTKTYAMAMNALTTLAKRKAETAVQQYGFSTDTSQNGINEMKEAEAILKYMHDLHDAGVEGVSPTCVPYNIMITGWAGLAASRHHNAPFKAEEVLRKMMAHKDNGFMDAAPDRLSFQKVIKAWAVSGSPMAGKRANWWLRKMWNYSELESNAKMLPSTPVYNSVMEALAASEGAVAAENLLLDLGDKYREEKSETLCPNSESFAIVIRAWLHKAETEPELEDRIYALRRAVEWLSSLQEVENESNLSTAPEFFDGILRAAKLCARQRVEILELATGVFNNLKASRFQVDYVSYSLFLQVGIEALSGPDYDEMRIDFIMSLFHDCCEDGLVSKVFVQSLVNSPVYEEGWTLEESRHTANRLFPTWPLPSSWTRNIRSPRSKASPGDLKRKKK